MFLNAKRLYFLLSGLVVLALVALGASVYIASGLLAKESTRVYDARLKTLALEEKQSRLTKARLDIDKYKELGAIAKSIVPRDKDQARTVREINNLAAASGIKLGAITFPSSTLGADLPATTTKKTAGTADSQLTPVKEIPGTYVLNISVKSDGKSPATFSNFIRFLEALEQNRRTALVTGVAITPDPKNPNNLQFTLSLDEYIKP